MMSRSKITARARSRVMARVALLIALVLAFATFSAVGPAQAAPALGSLTLLPATGLDTTPITLSTVSSGASKGCPAPATNVSGLITGPGGWAAGILAVGNSDAGVSQTSDFDVPVLDTMANLAAANNLAVLTGKYTITLFCQDELGVTQYGEFSAPLWFTSPTHFQSTDPAAPAPTSTTTTIAAIPASTAVAGSAVSLTASIAPATAAGTVQFTDTFGGSTVNVGPAVAVTGGPATASTTTLAVGTHSVTATFTPTNVAAFTASASGALAYVITRPASQPVVTSTKILATPAAGAVAGDDVSLTAQVSPVAATGTVQFVDTLNGTSTNVGTPTTVAEGVATLTTTSLSAASHSLKAVFTSADAAAFFSSSSDPLSYQVSAPTNEPLATSVTLTPAPVSPAVEGTSVTLSASVDPAAAGGTVQFSDGPANLGTPVSVVAGVASLTTAALTAGAHSLAATFTPADAAAYAPSTSDPVSYTVAPEAPQPSRTSITLTASPTGPAVAGDPVTFTATVEPSAAAGTVGFTETADRGVPTALGQRVLVVAGKASVTTSSLEVGSITVTADFAPTDPTTYLASQSDGLSYTISAPSSSPGRTSLQLQATPANTAKAGAEVTLEATLTPATAAGSVQFVAVSAGTTVALGDPVAVQGGAATTTARFGTAGSYALRAVFTDPSTFDPSSSADLSYTIIPADNHTAKRTRTQLNGWNTGWCPGQKIRRVGGPDDRGHHDGWNHRRCSGVVLVAEVRPRAATGLAQFTDTVNGRTTALSTPVPVSGGWAVLFVELTRGQHAFAATFTPQDPAAYRPSTSKPTSTDPPQSRRNTGPRPAARPAGDTGGDR
jgi:Bacterial Ig-like domain (group 3)